MTMNAPCSAFLRTLEERGYVHQITNREGLDAQAASGTLTAYIGFDMTAKSLHVGNLLPIMILRRMQQNQVKPIVLLGGATTRIGDPSDKDTQRPLLSDADIAANKASIRKVFERYLRFGDGPHDAIMVDNSEWLEEIKYVEFLRQYGPHFTINRMLTFDSVKRRLDREQPLTFLEFNYMLMQAVDFLELHKRHRCLLQAGGSDQWGNIVNGVELVRRIEGAEAFGVTTPLLTSASGQKMGKTASGAVWLNADMLSPFEFWQYWRNMEDASVEKCLKLFTDLPMAEISHLAALSGSDINHAKIVLANEVTALAHGVEAARDAESTSRAAFGRGEAAEGLPSIEKSREAMKEGLPITQALEALGLVSTRSEARRHIAANAVRVNDHLISDPNFTLQLSDFDAEGAARLSVGRKKIGVVRLS